MAVETHVVTLSLMNVDSTGTVYNRSTDNRQIKQNLNFSTEHRVVVDSSISTTTGNPTIKEYLELEAANDFRLVQIFQSMIITEKVT
jgi:hypothetical protein